MVPCCWLACRGLYSIVPPKMALQLLWQALTMRQLWASIMCMLQYSTAQPAASRPQLN